MSRLLINNLKSDSLAWKNINWKHAQSIVSGIQARIVKAVQAGDKNRVRSLQRLLARSFAAKLLAVKRVTTNRGKNTPGVDGVTWKSPARKFREAQRLNLKRYRAKPLLRKYIPKSNKKKRPLGIPVIKDRAEQALELMALDPVAECRADGMSNGFRKFRSTHDAIGACFNALRLKGSPIWIFEGDIAGCFDNFNHQWMLGNIPAHQRKLRMWLKAGCMENALLRPTTTGTPQGGIISPTLANMALDGIESMLKAGFGRKYKIHFVRYADDFIITGATKHVLEDKVKPMVIEFLKTRGLELSETKTTITHINDGFDFLGFNIRKYKGTLLIKPAKAKIKEHLCKIKNIIKANVATSTSSLINKLNPIIRGWGYYYRFVVSKRVFSYVDHHIWLKLWHWAKRRHPQKGRRWIKDKYFQSVGTRHWVFREKQDSIALFRLSSIPIRRYIKIKAEANPYDVLWKTYFEQRLLRRSLPAVGARF
jgi:RNA-directed DNA polymerase